MIFNTLSVTHTSAHHLLIEITLEMMFIKQYFNLINYWYKMTYNYLTWIFFVKCWIETVQHDKWNKISLWLDRYEKNKTINRLLSVKWKKNGYFSLFKCVFFHINQREKFSFRNYVIFKVNEKECQTHGIELWMVNKSIPMLIITLPLQQSAWYFTSYNIYCESVNLE